jgi:hypothetical protein
MLATCTVHLIERTWFPSDATRFGWRASSAEIYTPKQNPGVSGDILTINNIMFLEKAHDGPELSALDPVLLVYWLTLRTSGP